MTATTLKIGFIGIGKIATAVIEGLCTSSMKDTIMNISPRNEEKSKYLADKYINVNRLTSNQEVIDQSDIIFLALRPPHAKEALSSLLFHDSHRIVSLIPLICHAELLDLLSPAKSITRAIPLPTVVNHNCPIPIYNPDPTIVDIFSNIGQPLPVSDENQLHALWTLTCLITPYYELLQELSLWTTAYGVDKTIANTYIANLFQSLSYTAQLADPIEFDELAKHAATPNGLNEKAGKQIRSAGAHQAFREAADMIRDQFPR